jgi:CubicO group peptidase (beta-lactamase class C family)
VRSASAYEPLAGYFDAEIRKGRLPGAVLFVQRAGKVRCSEALGLARSDAGVPMAVDSLFRMWSLTKPMVCAGGMILVEEGRLALDDPVARYLPAFARMRVFTGSTTTGAPRLASPARGPMTIRDLMRHTSGLAYPAFTTNPELKRLYAAACLEPTELSSAEFVARLAEIPLAHEPGAAFAYGYSTDVLGCVIEQVSGVRLGEFLRKRLFEPLEMPDTGFHVAPGDEPRLAEPAPGSPTKVFDPRRPPAMDGGGGRAVSSARDVARFCKLLLDDGSGARILRRESVEQMAADQLQGRESDLDPGMLTLGSPGYSYGLGLGVRLARDEHAIVPGTAGELHWTGTYNNLLFIDRSRHLIGLFLSAGVGDFRHEHRRAFKRLVHEAETKPVVA